MLATMLRTSVGLLLWFSISSFAAAPNVAFFYGANPPWDVLRAYDIVVVEPAHGGIDPQAASTASMQVFAYLSVGEVEYDRPYAKDLPEGMAPGANEAWRSHVVDQTHPEWPRFFTDRIVAPLWQAGYRGFFLDTLDSFHLISKTDEERAKQAQGLATVVRGIRARFPQARLIFNRGFEILPEVHRDAYAVAAESLFHGWDQKNRAYRPVPEVDRAWLLRELERVRSEYNLPVIGIDYAPPGRRDLAREIARQIAALGFAPWVSNSDLDQVGVGLVEVAPSTVLMLYEGSGIEAALYASRIKQATASLNALGYKVEYADISKALPAYPLVGRYAGIVSWLASDQAVRKPGVREWLGRQREHGMRMAILGSFPFPFSDALASTFGLSAGLPRAPRELKVDVRDPLIANEVEPDAFALFMPLRANEASPTLLRLRSDRGDTMDVAALMPWGGYVLAPYESTPLAGARGDRWLIQAGEFMRRALALPTLPAAATIDTAPRRMPSRSSAFIPGCRVEGDGTLLTAPAHTPHELKQNAIERFPITCAS